MGRPEKVTPALFDFFFSTGLLTLWGDLEESRPLFEKYFSVWRRYGFLPEAFNLQTKEAQPGLGASFR
jgi:hypothetical protein